MTIQFITLNQITKNGSWYEDTHSTYLQALATRRHQQIEYVGSITRILKCENNVFTDITFLDELTPELIYEAAMQDLLDPSTREETENAKA